MNILVTGAAGFIGFHLTNKLLKAGHKVIGIDNLNSYYSQKLKKSRIELLYENSKQNNTSFHLEQINLEDEESINNTFQSFKPECVINLAAQAGVRYSIKNPKAYIDSNIVGFGNILEATRNNKVRNLIYASSSSVYGGNTKTPFSEKEGTNHPVSLYAASKKANELMAHSYSHLYEIPTIGLRFFTVYGPWGRPDMALFLFTKAIFEDEPINIFNNGNMIRDFTYIDDITESISRLINKPATPNSKFNKDQPDPSSSWAPYKIFNIGNSNPINLMNYIYELEEAIGKKALKNYLPMQQGDVPKTEADVSLLENWINFKPRTTIKEGIKNFVDWYKKYYM